MKKVCVAVPCFNEGEGIPSLALALKILKKEMENAYAVSWLFIDDGSTDDTFSRLEALAAEIGHARVIRHFENRNLGAALHTASKNLPSCDFVCFLDSDCTYSPLLLIPLLACLERGAQLATVSPYHPEGRVEGVPEWRLILSRGLSFIYRLISGSKIHTFTALVRAQDARYIEPTLSERTDFTFLAEVLLNHIRLGLKIEEVPAVLKTRQFGASKMRILRVIIGHLGLISRNLLLRAGGP